MRQLTIAIAAIVLGGGAASAQQTVRVDLAAVGSVGQTIEPGDLTVVIENHIPMLRYDIAILRESIPIATLPLDGITMMSVRGEMSGCDALKAAVSSLLGAAREADVPATAAAVRAALQAGSCPAGDAVAAAQAAVANTTQTFGPIHVRPNDRVTVTISRPASTGREAASWTIRFDTEPRGEWLTTFGVSFVPNADELYFSKSVGDSKYQITRQRDESGQSVHVIPSVYFSWLSAASKQHNLSISPTAGIGLSSDSPAFFAGVSFTFNQNIGVVIGGSVAGVRRLQGAYKPDQLVSENLSDDQLHRRVYQPQVFAAVTYRFGRNPFKDDTPPPATPPSPAAPSKTGDSASAHPPADSPAAAPATRPEAAVRDPDVRLHFDVKGVLTDPLSLSAVVDRARSATDVFIISHGWWNDEATADCFYTRIIGGIQASRPDFLTSDRFKPLFVSIYWPSALFPMEPGDCAASPTGPGTRTESTQTTTFSADRVRQWAAGAFPDAKRRSSFDVEVSRTAALLEKERTSALTGADAAELATTLVQWQRASGEDLAASDGPEAGGFAGSGEQVAKNWQFRPESRQEFDLSSLLSKKWLNFGNAFTFWTMKQRAGVVGASGGYELLKALQPARESGVHVHLIGHSFGGKLLTASLTGSGRAPNHADSLIILQGAFSQFAFATADQIKALGVSVEKDGLYVNVLRGSLVSGPIVATHTTADLPNRLLYPAGVALTNDVTERATASRYGALGANGILGPRTTTLNLSGQTLGAMSDVASSVSVDASGIILGHSDLVKPQVFRLIWDAISLSAGR